MDEPDDGDDLEFDDEFDEQWVAEWDEVDRQAVELLRGALQTQRGQPAPAGPLAEAAAAVRGRLRDGDHPLDWVGQAAGLKTQPVPEADAELLIRLAAATISPAEETGLDVEEESMLMSLEHADWLGAVITAVRNGPGSDASPEALVAGVGTCPELELESALDVDDESDLDAAFWIVALPWEVLGLTDRDQRLTELGEWVLPRALARAWNGDFDDGGTASTT